MEDGDIYSHHSDICHQHKVQQCQHHQHQLQQVESVLAAGDHRVSHKPNQNKSSAKSRRPDVEVYVPRARRIQSPQTGCSNITSEQKPLTPLDEKLVQVHPVTGRNDSGDHLASAIAGSNSRILSTHKTKKSRSKKESLKKNLLTRSQDSKGSSVQCSSHESEANLVEYVEAVGNVVELSQPGASLDYCSVPLSCEVDESIESQCCEATYQHCDNKQSLSSCCMENSSGGQRFSDVSSSNIQCVLTTQQPVISIDLTDQPRECTLLPYDWTTAHLTITNQLAVGVINHSLGQELIAQGVDEVRNCDSDCNIAVSVDREMLLPCEDLIANMSCDDRYGSDCGDSCLQSETVEKLSVIDNAAELTDVSMLHVCTTLKHTDKQSIRSVEPVDRLDEDVLIDNKPSSAECVLTEPQFVSCCDSDATNRFSKRAPVSAKPAAAAGNGDDYDDNDDDEADDWDKLFDETGEALSGISLQQRSPVASSAADVKVKKSPIDYYSLVPRDTDMSADEYGHLIEIYDFPAQLQTCDLIAAFIDFKDKGFDIKWVDDTHAIGVFSSSLAASSAIAYFSNPLMKVQSISSASRQTKLKAKRTVEYLQPYKPRPETSASVARNLVAGALGLKTRVSKETRDEERRKLKQAKERKRETVKQKNDAWDGAIAP